MANAVMRTNNVANDAANGITKLLFFLHEADEHRFGFSFTLNMKRIGRLRIIITA